MPKPLSASLNRSSIRRVDGTPRAMYPQRTMSEQNTAILTWNVEEQASQTLPTFDANVNSISNSFESLVRYKPQVEPISSDDDDVVFLEVVNRDSSNSLKSTTSAKYNPQVEEISSDEEYNDGDVLTDNEIVSTGNELVQEVNIIDREIPQTEHIEVEVEPLGGELEEPASLPNSNKNNKRDLETNQSLTQRIYAENRRKAREAYHAMTPFGPTVEAPLYNQPSDTNFEVIAERHKAFKPRLMAHLRNKAQIRHQYEMSYSAMYSHHMAEWTKKVDEIEKDEERKTEEAKQRDLFEKMFPELKKRREGEDRCNRLAARAKSDADMDQIMDDLQKQEMKEKKVRLSAVIPPIILEPSVRKFKYINNNCCIPDLAKFSRERALNNCWTPKEHEIFKEQYLQHPKNFAIIASFLEKKSVADCVQHYYLTKKQERYKQQLRKGRSHPRRNIRGPSRPRHRDREEVSSPS